MSFADAARDNLHYILGRNTFSLSWVTQLGENPFHASASSPERREPLACALAGAHVRRAGRAGGSDAVLAALPKDTPPAKIYADKLASYASNEICINWQAALVFLLAGELR